MHHLYHCTKLAILSIIWMNLFSVVIYCYASIYVCIYTHTQRHINGIKRFQGGKIYGLTNCMPQMVHMLFLPKPRLLGIVLPIGHV